MSKIAEFLVLIAISLVVGGCALNPEKTITVESSQPAPQQLSTVTPEMITLTGTSTLTPTSSTPTPHTTTSSPHSTTPVPPSPTRRFQLSNSDQVVLTISNPESFSGREGDARPNWLGWGAEAFAVAPDGSFWLADTAVYPNRLLHYGPQSELLQEISLADQVVYASDLAIARGSLWVLDISSQQPKVIQFDMHGTLLSSIPVDVSHGTFYMSLMTCYDNQLLLIGSDGYTELIATSGEITRKYLPVLSCFGHKYQAGTWQKDPIKINSAPFEATPDFIAGPNPFLGFNPDGSFAITGYGVDSSGQPDWQQGQVRYYDGAGKLLGMSRQRPMNIYKDWYHALAFGPDGSVYQLLSNPDHSVQIVRLGFSSSLPPIVTTPTVTPTSLSPMQSSLPAATDEEQARNALLSFFSNLSTWNYSEAVRYFGGDISSSTRPQDPSETLDDYWNYNCKQLHCLAVAAITDIEQVSKDEYMFYTVFVNPDGSRFEIGACCGGDPAATPPIWQFAYPVKKINGVWKVMRGPLYTP